MKPLNYNIRTAQGPDGKNYRYLTISGAADRVSDVQNQIEDVPGSLPVSYEITTDGITTITYIEEVNE